MTEKQFPNININFRFIPSTLFLLLIVFWGEPDLLDAIIQRILP